MSTESNKISNRYLREIEESIKLIHFFLSLIKLYMIVGGLVLIVSIIINIFYKFSSLNVVWSVLYILFILISGSGVLLIFSNMIKRKQLLLEILISELNRGDE